MLSEKYAVGRHCFTYTYWFTGFLCKQTTSRKELIVWYKKSYLTVFLSNLYCIRPHVYITTSTENVEDLVCWTMSRKTRCSGGFEKDRLLSMIAEKTSSLIGYVMRHEGHVHAILQGIMKQRTVVFSDCTLHEDEGTILPNIQKLKRVSQYRKTQLTVATQS